MGCFSFLCKECGKGVNSTSFSGEIVKLYLLEGGGVTQFMEGEYDSYGRVFIGKANEALDLRKSVEWSMDWHDVCHLMFSDDKDEGIAAVHTKCFKEVPTTQSENDPNQGWGDGLSLLGDCSSDHEWD